MLLLAAFGGCVTPQVQGPRILSPSEARAELVRRMPAQANDREGWATDIYAALATQQIDATLGHLCAVLAVAEQESGFQVDPVVAGLPKIARREIFKRSEGMHIPDFLVNAALHLTSSNGKTYDERIEHVRTEKEMSAIFEDFIGMAPLGQKLFGRYNPVHTIGPMQVSLAFAEAHAQGYPYPVKDSLRHELFTRRGGVWFGVAHLLGYPADYPAPLYRFADYNAGRYASRNAAFQNAVSSASGIPLAHDGILIKPDSGFDEPGATEQALRSLGKRLELSDRDIRAALERAKTVEFENTELYRRVYALAERAERRRLARAAVPDIHLEGPKISRDLSTAWYAQRVDERYQRCLRKD